MALAILRDYLSVLSFKDLVRERVIQDDEVRWVTRVVPLGQGYGEWPTLLRALWDLDFGGPVSLRFPKR